MPRLRSLLVSSSIIAAALALPRTALAYERQWHVGLDLNYSAIVVDPPIQGIGGGLHLAYGINDMFNIVAQADAAYHEGGLFAASGAAGVTNQLDVIEIVPYVGLMVGGYDFYATSAPCGGADQASCHQVLFGASIPFGLDYTITRSFILGASGRYHFLVGPGGIVNMITAGVKAEYVWGY